MNTPENITDLKPNEIFVFGSNYAGIHGAGAALLARQKFGAITGNGLGLMGQSYGIATKNRKLETIGLPTIQAQIVRLFKFAASRPELTFLVTKIGCGLAGYSVEEIAPLFRSKEIPANVILPKEFE